MKKFVLLIFFSCLLYNLQAQTDSLKKEILGYDNTVPEIISKARRMLIDKIEEEDLDKVKGIKDYLKNDIDNTSYLTLHQGEYWLILYWTQEYDELLRSIEQYGYQLDPTKPYSVNNQIITVNDQLYSQLLIKSWESKHILDVMINASELRQEEMDFLKLHLNYSLRENSNAKITQDILNKQSEEFLLKYPGSPYGPFVKKVISFKEQVAQFGWAYDVFFGYTGMNGKIADSFSDYFSFGASIDLIYSNFVLNLAFSLGSSTLKKDIDYQSVIWDKDLMGDFIIPHATLGYTFFNDKRMNFTTSFGISSIYISPQYEDIQNYSAYEDIEFTSGASWNAGLSLNFYTKPVRSHRLYYKMKQFQFFVKFKYNYYHSGFKNDFYGFDGSLHMFTISFGGQVHRVFRSF